MKQISRELFNELRDKGFIIETHNNKNFYITGKNKGKSKRKKIYICENVLQKYERFKRNGQRKSYNKKYHNRYNKNYSNRKLNKNIKSERNDSV